jgi:hypothetical protein
VVLTQLVLRVAAELDAAGLPFAVIGGMAVSTWIEPRLTHDVDLAVQAKRRDGPRLRRALVAAGARVTALEMRLLFDRKFVRLKTTTGLRLDLHVATSAHDREALSHAEVVRLGDREIRVAGPEDLVLMKLVAWRPQDRLDIANLLAGVRDLRRDYVERWLGPLERQSGAPIAERWRVAQGQFDNGPARPIVGLQEGS